MKAHNGMRPLDVVILLKIISLRGTAWQYRDLSAKLYMSVSEVSESLNRSHIAGLIDDSKKNLRLNGLMEFIEFGLSYVFPVVPGQIITGIPTAYSHPFYKLQFSGTVDYVWKSEQGSMRGLSIEPLHKGVPQAVLEDELLYKLLASIDILRVGRSREKKMALEQLKMIILNESKTESTSYKSSL
ncbi:hypothetical protein [Dyadobacter psychrotolerans]|nr:hypothetical protein [Dyadobacter psychrotolerans]